MNLEFWHSLHILFTHNVAVTFEAWTSHRIITSVTFVCIFDLIHIAFLHLSLSMTVAISRNIALAAPQSGR